MEPCKEEKSKKQLIFLRLRANSFQLAGGGCQNLRSYPAGMLGANLDAAHAGNAELGVGVFGRCGRDGLNRAEGSTAAAAVAGIQGLGNHGNGMQFLIGAVAGYGRLARSASLQVAADLAGKILQLLFVPGIGAAGGELMHDGVLGHSRHSGITAEAGSFQNIFQLGQGILKSPVAISRGKYGPGAAALDLPPALSVEFITETRSPKRAVNRCTV